LFIVVSRGRACDYTGNAVACNRATRVELRRLRTGFGSARGRWQHSGGRQPPIHAWKGAKFVSSWKDWIAQRFGVHEGDEDPARDRDLAVAALLIEVLRADYDTSFDERRQVIESIGILLKLDAAACEALLADAELNVDRAYDLHQFTSRLNESLSHPEKRALMEQLWRVARADGVVHKYEEHLIRRVADLLHMSHREFIAAKLRTEES
jgi:uncharacterized tellurite resistance protein B-like protein